MVSKTSSAMVLQTPKSSRARGPSGSRIGGRKSGGGNGLLSKTMTALTKPLKLPGVRGKGRGRGRGDKSVGGSTACSSGDWRCHMNDDMTHHFHGGYRCCDRYDAPRALEYYGYGRSREDEGQDDEEEEGRDDCDDYERDYDYEEERDRDDDDDDDDETFARENYRRQRSSASGDDGMCGFGACASEVTGSYQDLARSLFQVSTACVLREHELDGVVGAMHRASLKPKKDRANERRRAAPRPSDGESVLVLPAMGPGKFQCAGGYDDEDATIYGGDETTVYGYNKGGSRFFNAVTMRDSYEEEEVEESAFYRARREHYVRRGYPTAGAVDGRMEPTFPRRAMGGADRRQKVVYGC
ncbi:hypothetical protein ACHAWF_017913 [Thalassiosira exigua]